MKKLIFIALIFMFLLSSAFSYTAPTFEGQPIIVESSSDFYGSSTGRVTIDLNLTSINTTFKDFFIRIRGLDDTNVIVKEISFNKTKIGTLSYPVQQVSKTKINQKLMDKAPLQIVLEFDPLELGVGKEFDIQLVDKDNLIIADLDPFLSGWDYRQQWSLNTDGISLSGDITNDHAILFTKSSSDTDFWGAVLSTGADVRFTDASNNLYSFHFEDFNYATNSFNAWVKVTDTFTSGADVTGYMYYGNAGASDVQNENDTYPSGYKAVYHMDSVDDSTSNNKDLTATDSPTLTTTNCKIGRCYYLDGSNDYFRTADIGLSSGSDFSLLLTFRSAGNSGVHIFDGVDSTSSQPSLEGADATEYKFYYNNGTPVGTGVISTSENYSAFATFKNVAGTRTNQLFLNGASRGTGSPSGDDPIGAMWIGVVQNGGSRFFKGTLDEIQFLDYAITSDEAILLYNSMNNSLVSYTAQEGANNDPDLNITSPTADLNWAGTHAITFNVLDIDADATLDVNLFYSSSAGSQTNLIIHDSNLADGSGITCSDYNFQDSTSCSYDWDTTTASDGVYYIDGNVSDGVGNDLGSSPAFRVDNTNPTATSIVITDVGGRTEDKTPALTLSASDSGSGLKEMAFSCNGSTWGSWIIYNSSYSAFDVTTGAGCSATYGAKTIYLKVRDNADLESNSVSDSTILDAVVTYGDLNLFLVGDYTKNADLTINSDHNIEVQFKATSDDLNVQSAKWFYQSPFNDANCSGYIRGGIVCGFQEEDEFDLLDVTSTTFTLRSESEDDHAFIPYAYNTDPDDYATKSATSVTFNSSGDWAKTLISNVMVDSNIFYNMSWFGSFTGVSSRTLNVYDCNSDVADPVGNGNCFSTPFTAGSVVDDDGYYSVKHISNDSNQIAGVNLNVDGNHFIYYNCPTCNPVNYWEVSLIDFNSNIDKTRNSTSATGVANLVATDKTIDTHYHFIDIERNNTFSFYFTIDNNQGKTYTSTEYNELISVVNLAPEIDEFISPTATSYTGFIDVNMLVSDPETDTLVCDFNLVNTSLVYVGTLAEDISPVDSICHFDFNSLAYPDANYLIRGIVRETGTSELLSDVGFSQEFEVDNVLPQNPIITIVYPNGNESFTSDVDTPTIIFTLKDVDSTPLYVNLNYSATTGIGSGTAILFEENVITSGVVVCDDSDFTNDTNCSYTWDISGVADGNYYLNMVVSDGVLDANDVSDGDFIIVSTPPVVSPVVYNERYINPNYEQRDENIYFSASQGYSLTDEEKQNIYLQQVTLILVIIGIIIGIGVFILWKRKK